MLQVLSYVVGLLPLRFVHFAGAWLGILMNAFSQRSASLRHENLKQSGLCLTENKFKTCIASNIRETGKSVLETLFIWGKREADIQKMVVNTTGWELVNEAFTLGKGIIFLTPHLGCFEITSRYYALFQPITVLYRAPKKSWLKPFVTAGRSHPNILLAEANAGGVRKLLNALKQGQAIGILPDQIPAAGEGEWADFFGKPAYTMTLASKLAIKTGARVIMAFGERLPEGRGYIIHLTNVPSLLNPLELNQALERQIREKPEQYLWQYHRYKQRRHALRRNQRGQP